jgi:hypothetical protein
MTMLTVSEAARRAGRHPETIRRLDALTGPDTLPVPDGWTRTVTGEPMPDILAVIRGTWAAR